MQRLLTASLNKLFTKKSFEGDFALVSNVDGIKGKNITMPDGIRYGQRLRGHIRARTSPCRTASGTVRD